MRYEVLGPLRLADRNRVTAVGPPKVQAVLAVLLIRAGELVTRDQLIAEIWADDPPRRATAALQVYVSQLRKILAAAGFPATTVVTHQAGYVLHKGAQECDADIVLRLAANGRALSRHRRYPEAIRALESALALWHGPVLGGLRAGHLVDGFVTRLEETRMACLETLIDCRLASGLHRELVGPLHSIVAEHPTRETFHRQLMIALYRSDRQADALNVYHLARKTLDDQLGVRPGRMLQRVQQAILRADDELLATCHAGGSEWTESA
ncbi:AfsR/SARP family transcriptional regulator [Amycolatopsis plumensis]|uniref:BTAD domain-containing putative transcriptional regulator n=1 Tax=Amycolatopsis plumensis TaxID=236508 RepID=A0ABV5UA70_9PSEU